MNAVRHCDETRSVDEAISPLFPSEREKQKNAARMRPAPLPPRLL